MLLCPYIWQSLLMIIAFPSVGRGIRRRYRESISSWKTVEGLAEHHPYIVALLTASKQFSCTGLGIQSQTVLTTGNCIVKGPRYILYGTAALGKYVYKKNLLEVVDTSLHPDYFFQTRTEDPNNITLLHSNLGLVYVNAEIQYRNVLDLYVCKPYFSNAYASELEEKVLTVIGYGKRRDSQVFVLQKQSYMQTPCPNPKWYYCVCGIETRRSSDTVYDEPFGEGGAVFYGNEIVALTVMPCGVLELPQNEVQYNIFTVLAPYTSWMDKDEEHHLERFRARENSLKMQNLTAQSSKLQIHGSLKYIWHFLVVSKFFI